MRRPLFIMCLCLIMMIALGVRISGYPRGETESNVSPLEGEILYVTGRVSQKDTQSFILKISTVSLQQNSFLTDQKISTEFSQQNSILQDQEISTESPQQRNPALQDQEISTESPQQRNPNLQNKKILCEYPGDNTYLMQSEPVQGQMDGHAVQLGDVLTISGTYAVFSEATNPGEFDTKEFYAAQKISGKLKNVNIISREKATWNWREHLYHMRRKWQRRLYAVFPEKEASVLTAMLLGDKTNLDADMKNLYKRNGIIHILSISGLHITLIGMGIYKLLRKSGLPIWVSALVGGCILLLYGVMTGMGVSTVRAILMYLIHMLAIVIGRTYDMLTALAVSGVVLVVWNPDNLGYAGFLFSFSAILGIGVLLPALTPEEKYIPQIMETTPWKKVARKRISKCWMGLQQSLLSGTAIWLFTLPVQLWFYYEIPVYSIFLNLLILPLMSMVMVTGLLVMLIPGTGVLGTGTYIILKGYEVICTCFDKLPFHTWNPGKPSAVQVIVYYACLLLVVVCRQRNLNSISFKTILNSMPLKTILNSMPFQSIKIRHVGIKRQKCRSERMKKGKFRNIVFTFLGVAVAIFILTGSSSTSDRVTFLDVGQGDGIVLELKTGEVFIIDCGSSSRTHVGQKVLIPYLKYRGISRVDGVFLSHPDKDHCNGVLELLENEEGIMVDQVILPAIAKQQRDEFEEIFQAARGVSEVGDIPIEYTKAENVPSRYVKAGNVPIEYTKAENVPSRYVKAGDIPIKYMKAGDMFTVGDMFLLCLHPPKGYSSADSNSYSQCIYVEIGNASFLFTGDVEQEGEELLMEQLKEQGISTVSVLKAAHHGSKYSTSDAFLDTLHPQIAILSAGRKNSYGHPHQETLDRLQEHKVDSYRTDQAGAITLEIKRQNLKLSTFR